jgi:hypothetical protein
MQLGSGLTGLGSKLSGLGGQIASDPYLQRTIPAVLRPGLTGEQ